MASSELTDLTEATALADDDLFYTVVDPGGTPLDRKITKANLKATIGDLEAAPALSGSVVRMRLQATAGIGGGTYNSMRASPIALSAGTLDRIGAHHWANGAASEVLRLGIYRDASGRPGALLLDAGTIDLSTAPGQKTITINQAITTGLYWLVSVTQGPTNTATFLAHGAPGNTASFGIGGFADITGQSNYQDSNAQLYRNGISGALPDPYGTPTLGTAGGDGTPIIVVRYA